MPEGFTTTMAAAIKEPVEAGTHVMHVLDSTGDTRIVWDSERATEVATARAAFDEAKRKGYVAYSVSTDGERDAVMSKFDPTAEKIILAPALRGGQ